MGKRLKFNTDKLQEIVKIFNSMYVEDKLYDYVNYLLISRVGNKIAFDMCIIMDTAYTDSMVRLFSDEVEEGEDFSLSINFVEFAKVVKSFKEEYAYVTINDNNVFIECGNVSHYMELSTTSVPTKIAYELLKCSNLEALMVDFRLANLYNDMKSVESSLQYNALTVYLYGIMACPSGVIATNSFTMSYVKSNFFSDYFLFPRHSLKILSQLPKIGAKYIVQDHKIYIIGEGYQLYIGEWSGFTRYPTDKILDILSLAEQEEIIISEDSSLLESIINCHRFDAYARVNFKDGYVESNNKKHREQFTPITPVDYTYVVHGEVIKSAKNADKMGVVPLKGMLTVYDGDAYRIIMGVKEATE